MKNEDSRGLIKLYIGRK